MTDYITLKKDYKPSLKKVSLNKLIELKNLSSIDAVKIEVVDVTSLGDTNVTRKTITVPTKIKTSGNINVASKALSAASIKVNGFVLLRLKLTAVDEGLWDTNLQSKIIKVKLGSPIARMKQKIAKLEKQNKQTLVTKNQEITELRRQNEQVLATQTSLKQQKDRAVKNATTVVLEEAKRTQQIITQIYAQTSADLLKKTKAYVSKPENQSLEQVISTAFNKQAGARLRKEWMEERQLTKSFFSNHTIETLNNRSNEPYIQIYKILVKYSDIIKSNKVAGKKGETMGGLSYEIEAIGRLSQPKYTFSNKVEGYEKTYVDLYKFTQSSIETLARPIPHTLANKTIDAQTFITAKQPLTKENNRTITLSQSTNAKEFFEVPADTLSIICYDETSGSHTASTNTSFISKLSDLTFKPGNPRTINMFTIAAKLGNGKITKPITFLTETPALAGSK